MKLIVAAVALVSTLTVGFVLVANDLLAEVYTEQAERLRADRIRELERRSLAVVRHVGDTAREAMAGNETGRLQRVLRDIADGTPEIEYAALADETGRVMVRSDMLVLDSLQAELHFVGTDPDGPSIAERELDGSRVREVTYPIQAEEAILGYLQVVWSMNQLEIDLRGECRPPTSQRFI